MFKQTIAFVFLLFSFSAQAQQVSFEKKFPVIDKFIDSVMKEWNIPGLALAIVYKDKLIYGKGYGFRDLEKKLPVTSATLFPIASNTKLFTSTSACILAEQGKLNLDTPATTYMSSLRFSTDDLNASITLRDMLSHRTGLPRYDGIWLNSPSRKEAVKKLVYMKPQLGFREGYIYNNMMFITSGVIMEEITGMSWEELTRKLIFQPLQMNASSFTNDEMRKYGNYSLSYFEPDSTHSLKPRQFEGALDALGPAGTIKTSVEDMSHWMIAQLNKGKWNNQQAISAKAIAMTLEPNTISDKEGKWDELSNSLYCLGRSIQTYKGYKITSHTGSIDGFYSNLTFIPGQEIGVYVVFNAVEAGSLRSIISFPVIDRLLNLSLTPWTQRYRKDYLEAKGLSKRREQAMEALQVKNTAPSHPLSAYTGSFSNPIYGKIEISNENNKLMLSFRSIRSEMHHFHYDQFTTKEEKTDTPSLRLSFLTNSRGQVDKISTSVFGDPIVEFVRN